MVSENLGGSDGSGGSGLDGSGLDASVVELVVREHRAARVPRLARYWSYYRNEERAVGARADAGGVPARRELAQERGLPGRLRGVRGEGGVMDDDRAARAEVVIENDIAWRVHAMVDFMFGRPPRVFSTARDARLRGVIGALLDAVWERSGGVALLQDAALLGHVYGHVDLLVRCDFDGVRAAGRVFGPGGPDEEEARDLARLFRVEVVEPTRGVPVVNPGDWRVLDGYVIDAERVLNEPVAAGGLRGLVRRSPTVRRRTAWREVHTGRERCVLVDGRCVERVATPWTGGEVPVAHIQNVAQPFRYEGLGEVEPLIPLQDELNTRLSDRASRVTLQNFKMYLARGIEGFDRVPVRPGTVWSTDNPEASIEAFGGDASSPSEEAHIEQVREALDKQSGVPPLASGVVRARIGNLSSANALRVTLMGVLSKTARKRVTYGRGMSRVCELVLRALDAGGVLETSERDRGVRWSWPDPLPADPGEEARAAQARIELGADTDEVLGELGYATRAGAGRDAGVS